MASAEVAGAFKNGVAGAFERRVQAFTGPSLWSTTAFPPDSPKEEEQGEGPQLLLPVIGP